MKKTKEHFNWKRKLPKLNGAFVPLIPRPLPLPKHTTVVISSVDIHETALPFLVAKRIIDHMKKQIAYTHRLHDNAIIGSEETRWRSGANEF